MRGVITIEELRALVETHEVDTVVVAFTDNYGRFQGKRYDVEFFLDGIHSEATHACDYLLTVDMEMEPVPGYAYSNWETGYGGRRSTPAASVIGVPKDVRRLRR